MRASLWFVLVKSAFLLKLVCAELSRIRFQSVCTSVQQELDIKLTSVQWSSYETSIQLVHAANCGSADLCIFMGLLGCAIVCDDHHTQLSKVSETRSLWENECRSPVQLRSPTWVMKEPTASFTWSRVGSDLNTDPLLIRAKLDGCQYFDICASSVSAHWTLSVLWVARCKWTPLSVLTSSYLLYNL